MDKEGYPHCSLGGNVAPCIIGMGSNSIKVWWRGKGRGGGGS